MNDYVILTNRKRAVVALVHSAVFLALALRTLILADPANPMWHADGAGIALRMPLIYLVVSSILIQLVRVSRCLRERLYFGFCASSATLGLLRAILGDSLVPAGQVLRVVMLVCAVLTGTLILRNHPRSDLVAEGVLAGSNGDD